MHSSQESLDPLLEREEEEVIFSEDDSLDNVVLENESAIHHDMWKVLVVDDEEQVHKVTRLALKKFSFDHRSLEILSAYSAKEAEKILRSNQDTAVVFLDVVMESNDAGLKLIHFIRTQLNNQHVRIILRTGQPGQAPELSIVEDYDINDYKTKTELTQAKLFSALITAIRSYRDIVTVEESRQEIEKLNRRLQRFNVELEQKVQARTQELEKQNKRLEQEIEARLHAQRRLEAANSQLNQANRKLSFWANFDELTTLSNRRCFDKYLEQLWRQAFREQQSLCIILSDIDYFKEFNDNYGHLAGDDCLKRVGIAFRDVVERPLDLAARYGGEEFVIVLHDTDIKGGMVVAQKIHYAIDALKIKHQGSSVSDHISMSLGVTAIIPRPGISCEMLIAQADSALYQAKGSGRNQVIQFQP